MVKYEYRRGGHSQPPEAAPMPSTTALSPPIIFAGVMLWSGHPHWRLFFPSSDRTPSPLCAVCTCFMTNAEAMTSTSKKSMTFGTP